MFVLTSSSEIIMKSAHRSGPAILMLEIVLSQQRRNAGKRKINFIFSSCWPC